MKSSKPTKETLHKNIKYLRTKCFSMPQRKFAPLIGVTHAALGAYEEGRSRPKEETLIKLSEISGLSILDLLKVGLEEVNFSIDKPLENTTVKVADNSIETSKAKGNILDIRRLVVSEDEKGNEKIIMVPQKAAAHYLEGYTDPSFMNELPKFNLPFLQGGANHRAFEIIGDSMLPLPSGSIVVGEYIKDWHNIKSGQTYIVVSNNDGVVYKRVINKVADDKRLYLYSDNTEYAPFDIPISEVKEVWRAKRFIINNALNYDVFIDRIFAQITELREEIKKYKN